jgi:hypothetical protein
VAALVHGLTDCSGEASSPIRGLPPDLHNALLIELWITMVVHGIVELPLRVHAPGTRARAFGETLLGRNRNGGAGRTKSDFLPGLQILIR